MLCNLFSGILLLAACVLASAFFGGWGWKGLGFDFCDRTVAFPPGGAIRWDLGPTSILLALITGLPLVAAPREGYLQSARLWVELDLGFNEMIVDRTQSLGRLRIRVRVGEMGKEIRRDGIAGYTTEHDAAPGSYRMYLSRWSGREKKNIQQTTPTQPIRPMHTACQFATCVEALHLSTISIVDGSVSSDLKTTHGVVQDGCHDGGVVSVRHGKVTAGEELMVDREG